MSHQTPSAPSPSTPSSSMTSPQWTLLLLPLAVVLSPLVLLGAVVLTAFSPFPKGPHVLQAQPTL